MTTAPRTAARAPYPGAAGLRRPGDHRTAGKCPRPGVETWPAAEQRNRANTAQGSRPSSGPARAAPELTSPEAGPEAGQLRPEQGAARRCLAQPKGGRKRGAWLPADSAQHGTVRAPSRSWPEAARSGYFGLVSGGSGGGRPRPLGCGSSAVSGRRAGSRALGVAHGAALLPLTWSSPWTWVQLVRNRGARSQGFERLPRVKPRAGFRDLQASSLI